MISQSVQVFAPAKVNLTLDIVGKDETSGYHQVHTIVYKLPDLFDEIILTESDRIEISYEGFGVPADERNTVWRVLDLLGEKRWKVHLVKRIPVESGLGGGSSDAASVLRFLGDRQGLTIDQMREVGKKIGCDMPLFLTDGNVVYLEGRGDEVVEEFSVPDLGIFVFDSGVQVSTKDAYAGLDLESCGVDWKKTEELLVCLRKSQFDRVVDFVHNDFESSFFKTHLDLEGSGSLCGSGGWLWKMRNAKQKM
jgi:4-diphosphocytidyl-2-C-methyl-D-erythritol kinase